MTENTFTSDDVFLSSWLVLKGLSCSVETVNGRGFFCFPSNGQTNALIQEYHTQDAKLSPAEFAQTIKRLRAEMYAAKANGKSKN